MIKYFYSFFLFLMTAVTLPGQPDTYLFYHKTYTTDDGLSSRYIEDIYQDSRNYLWVSSDYGVNRFDGQKFKVYNQGKYNLESDNINQIREDQAGNIWFISRTPQSINNIKYWFKVSVNIFDFQQNKIIPVDEYFGGNLPFKWSEVVRITQDEAYVLWISTASGKVYRYTDRFTQSPIDSTLMAKGVLYPLANSGFLILKPGKIVKLNANLELIYQSDFSPLVKNVFSGENGQVFLLTIEPEKMLYKVNAQGQIDLFETTVDALGLPPITTRFGVDTRGRLWIEGPDAKISLYENGVRVLNNDLDKFFLAENGNRRISIEKDKSGGVWYSDINGLTYMSFNKSGFTPFMNNTMISMRGLYKLTDSTLFVNSYHGYFKLNINTGFYEPFEVEDFNGFSQDGILWNGYIYNSMYGPSVIKINLEDHSKEELSLNTDDLSIISKTFIASPDSMIVIGTNSGLYLLDPATDVISDYDQYNEFDELKNLIINSFSEVDGQVYISTEKGLFILDWKKGIVAHQDFKFNHLLDFYQDDDGVNWIATRGGGLLEWHPEDNDLVRQYAIDQGFSHDIIYTVYEDANDRLWLPSSKGLICFNKKDKTVINYFRSNGLPDNEFNQYAHFQDSDGSIYLGGVDGLVAFDPVDLRSIPSAESDPRIIVTDIIITRKDNRSYNYPENRINHGETLVLKGNVQSATLKFSLLEYDRLEGNQFFYKINGIHDTWQTMHNHAILLNRLPGGTNTVDVMVHAGINMQTHYSSLQVQVLRPFTETWLFYGICALGFLVLGISLSRYRIYRLDEINRKLEKKVQQRTQKIEDDKILISQQYREMEQINKTKDHLIAIIGHDLKDYVSTFEGIEHKINYLINSKQVERIPQLAEFIENSAHDLSLLLDNLLNWALKERGDLLLHPDSVSVPSILQDVLDRLNKLITKKEIVLILKIPDDLHIYVDGLTLHSLLRNIIHNAIKFSHRKGIVKIYHTEREDFVTLHVEDCGIGMTAYQVDQVLTDTDEVISTRGTENEAGTGMGLLLCREMLEMQSGTLNISSRVGEGTVFSIVLPNQIAVDKTEEIGV